MSNVPHESNRHTDQRLRSMELAAVAFIAFVFFLGGVCWEVLRGYVLGAL